MLPYMVNFKTVIPDEIFDLNKEFTADGRKEKINGGIGVYLDETGNPFVLPVVRKTIKFLDSNNFNYLPIAGNPSYLEETTRLVLGNKLYEKYGDKFAKQGVMGGTNGLFVWGSLIKEVDKNPSLIISNPTWENHKKIFSYLGFKIIEYDHLGTEYNFNFPSLVKALADNPSVYLLLQGGLTHNPTGVNPNKNQWDELVAIIKNRKQRVIFDFAYLGLGENIENDCYPIRLFIKNNIPVSIIISYSKNMTLYQHRTGVLLVFTFSFKEKQLWENHLQKTFRIINSNPAAFGELIVRTILSSKELKAEWIKEIGSMVKSLNKRRVLLADNLTDKFSHIKHEKGLFSLLGLTPTQIKRLKERYAIYLLSNSRINFGGIMPENIPQLTKSILSVL